MSYRIAFSDDARLDFENIADYIAQDNPHRAISFINEIEKRLCDVLGVFPRSGKIYKKDTRFIIIEDYVALYEIDDAGKTINILRLISGARDWKS
jgi:toxin ParE1/3/4